MAGEPPPPNGTHKVCFLFTYHTGHAQGVIWKERKNRKGEETTTQTPPASQQLSRDNRMPKVCPEFTYQEPKPANWNILLGFTATVQKDTHTHKPLQDEEPDKHGAGSYVFFQLKWLSGKHVYGIQLPLGLNSCD